MFTYKPYAVDATRCSILLHQWCQSNYCSNRYKWHLICLFDNPEEPLTYSAQPWKSLQFVGITTVYSWAWGRNTQCRVFLHLLERFDNAFLAGRHSWDGGIWFGGVQGKYNTEREGTCPWKVLPRLFSSLCIFWPQMFWSSGMIPWLALVYSTSQSSPRCSTEVGFWNGWW